MDFVQDVLDNDPRFRILTMVDKLSRECPLVEADFSMDAGKVIACLEWLKSTLGNLALEEFSGQKKQGPLKADFSISRRSGFWGQILAAVEADLAVLVGKQ